MPPGATDSAPPNVNVDMTEPATDKSPAPARRRKARDFNLFVYGTLMDPYVFRAVLGKSLVDDPARADGKQVLLARDAVLPGYKKVSPDNTYLYAVPDPHGRIRGYLIGPLPGEDLDALLKYEGRNYSRKRLRVQTKDGTEPCLVFIGRLKQLEYSFGTAFRDPLKQEILLQDKIDAALLEDEREVLQTEEKTSRRAMGELRGSTIRDIMRQHFDTGGISDYAIRQLLKDTPLPDFSRITKDPEARALAGNYLAMVVRQVIFNQFEENIRREFRYELDHMRLREAFYERTVSSLVALRMLNANAGLLNIIVGDCLVDLDFDEHRLVDYVRWAVSASDSVYDPAFAKRQLQYVRTHMGHGHVPIGAELEFSNIGHRVIQDPDGQSVRDSRYDGFLYFNDFGLNVLTWKLGGHVDDHHRKHSGAHRRGFFEIALGNVSIEANLSKPITDDPWLLNQFIQEAQRFYDIEPHSVHISFQLRSQNRPIRDRLLPVGVLKCLFALGGDARRHADGAFRVDRLCGTEIVAQPPKAALLFSEISRRRSRDLTEGEPIGRDPHDTGRYVQQFRFPRLSPETNYEVLALALKGIQIDLTPGTFLRPAQYETSRKHRAVYEELLEWGARPAPISEEDRRRFLTHVHDGLMTERRGKPAHGEAYIAWAISRLEELLAEFNAEAASPPKPASTGRP